MENLSIIDYSECIFYNDATVIGKCGPWLLRKEHGVFLMKDLNGNNNVKEYISGKMNIAEIDTDLDEFGLICSRAKKDPDKYDNCDVLVCAFHRYGLGYDWHCIRKNNRNDVDIPKGDQIPDDLNQSIFVSNLSFELESPEERLHEMFKECGEIQSIRAVRNSSTSKFRGFAYVTFTSTASVEKALSLDRTKLDGRPVFVSPNVDKNKNPDFKVFKYQTGLEKHKLFVSNLSEDTTEEDLTEAFEQHGSLKSARLVTTRAGKSKRIAFVEFSKEADAAQAVMKMDEQTLKGSQIKVAISNPPARNKNPTEHQQAFISKPTFTGGRGRGRTQLSLVPRSLNRPSMQSDNEKKKQVPASKKLNNSDFASLFRKST